MNIRLIFIFITANNVSRKYFLFFSKFTHFCNILSEFKLLKKSTHDYEF